MKNTTLSISAVFSFFVVMFFCPRVSAIRAALSYGKGAFRERGGSLAHAELGEYLVYHVFRGARARDAAERVGGGAQGDE